MSSILSGLGGSQSQTQSLPQHIQDWQKQQMALMQLASQMPPPIIGGAMVAAESPGQAAYNQQANAWSRAAGMPTMSPQQYLPDAQQFAGGVQGYSAMPGLMQNLGMMEGNFPGSLGPLYTMFPSLAPENYQYAGQSPWAEPGSTEDVLRELQELFYGAVGEDFDPVGVNHSGVPEYASYQDFADEMFGGQDDVTGVEGV